MKNSCTGILGSQRVCRAHRGQKLVAQSFQNCGLTHSRTLLPMVENLLANCGVSLALDAIAVDAIAVASV